MPKFDYARFPILAGLSKTELADLDRATTTIDIEADIPVALAIHEQQRFLFLNEDGIYTLGDTMPLYLLDSGELLLSMQCEQQLFEMGSILPGQAYGKECILMQPFCCTQIRPSKKGRLYVIPNELVRKFSSRNEAFRSALLQMSEKRRAATALAANLAFSLLPRNIHETILHEASFVSLSAGEILQQQGSTDTDTMYLVMEGTAEISKPHPYEKGRKIVFATAAPGDELGEICSATEQPYTATATTTAVTPLRLLKIPSESICTWRNRYPDFAHALEFIIEDNQMRSSHHTLNACAA